MAFDAKVFKVMIASPSDVEVEKKKVREIIGQWNDVHSERTKIVLLPVTWDTHSRPSTGAPPQEIINKQVLEGCDLLIGIFWTRLGTPTGKEDSGTVEEIKEHRKAGKPVMLYFSNAPVPPASIDSEQYECLKKFKEEYKKQGLIYTYDNIAEFRDKLNVHLVKTIHDEPYFKAKVEVPVETATETSDLPNLSREARDLLLEAVQDSNGSIHRIVTMGVGGLIVQTNNKNMVTGKDPRIQATWEDAIGELCDNGLIVDKTDERKLFKVTRAGYELADLLIKQ